MKIFSGICIILTSSNLTYALPISLPYQINTMTNSQGVHNYEYDNIDQLIQATHPSLPEENFMYDPLGNRNPLVNTHNAANRLLEDPDYTYTYDANGNRITREDIATGEVTTYHYNVENQLTQVDLPDGTTVNYYYDGLGRRIEKNLNGTITRYIYDGTDVLAEYNGANELIRNYVHGPSVDEPLELTTTGASTYYYISDGLGSVTALIDSAGNIVEQYRYDSFGNTTILNSISEEIPASAFGNRYMFTAREYDAETGLYYYRLRYYDPLIGRFLQEDPVGYLLGPNLYTYVNNNPVNWTDPWGLYDIGGPGYGNRSKYETTPKIETGIVRKDDGGYVDVGGGIGWGGGIVGGILVDTKGNVYGYIGGGGMTSPGGSATISPNTISPGLNVGLQFGFWGGLQVGYGFGKEGGPFFEGGLVTPGASLTGYWVFKVYDAEKSDSGKEK